MNKTIKTIIFISLFIGALALGHSQDQNDGFSLGGMALIETNNSGGADITGMATLAAGFRTFWK